MSEPARVTGGHGYGDALTALLDQICAGGARVKLPRRLAPGSVICLDFKTGPSDHHSVHARVVHARKEERGFNWLCGLCFEGVDPSETRRIDAYVEAERKRRETGFAMPRI